jgi:SAM-dependent methyltransferase
MEQDPLIQQLNLPESLKPLTAALNTEIHSEDGMYAGNRHHYFSCGASALNCILHSIGMSQVANIETILDFGSGAGRVTRWIRAAFPQSIIHACDIRESDLMFLKQTFDATTWVSGIDVSALMPRGLYDVIWVGSVFTHLSADVSTRLFDKLLSWLKPNGILIFSVHGRFVLHRANSGDNIYGLGDRWNDLVESYQSTGYGYADYPSQNGYGISVSKSGWWINLIERRPESKLICMSERAWDHHHDIIAVQKTGWD